MNEKPLPSYVKLFGEIDFRSGDDARSVYSPAAYLTDLLQLIDDEMQHPNATSTDSITKSRPSIFQNRPDIFQKILLDSDHTFTLLPYLDIVNEVLEKKIKEDSGSEAYDVLKRQKYPCNLPFNLDHKRIALYEKYLDVTPEAFHKTLAQDYDKDVVAREYLGLSEEEAEMLVTKRNGAELKACYGRLYRDNAIPKKKMPIQAFLDATGLTHLQLKALLTGNLDTQELEGKRRSTFFCNATLDELATYDATEKNIIWLKPGETEPRLIPDDWLDRAQRLIRLSGITGLAISELDLMLRDCCGNDLSLESLKRIAVIKHLSTTLDLKIDETCALFSDMSDMGHGDEELPADLFNRVFNGSFATLDQTYVGAQPYLPTQLIEFKRLSYSGDILALDNRAYRSRIAYALQISEPQLQLAIRGFRRRANEAIEDEDHHDSLWTNPTDEEEKSMLSTLYRFAKLAAVLETSFEDLFMLLDILERDLAVRQFANVGVFIDYRVTERNGYEMLRQGAKTEALLWLVPLLCSLTKWLAENGLTAEELLKISTGRYRRNLKENHDLNDNEKPSQETLARQAKIVVLNDLYRQLQPSLLDAESFVSETFDNRFSRIIHEVITDQDGILVAPAEARLVRSEDNAIVKTAHEAIARLDRVTKADFLGLGIEEKIADKIFANLVLMGYLNTDGKLNEAMLLTASENFSVETDFTAIRDTVFDAIQTLHEGSIDVAIYPSDLESLGLPKAHLDELYDNLIFNGFLSPDGTLLQTSTFASTYFLDLMEVNSGIGAYSRDVYDRIRAQVEKFKQMKIVITPDLFAELPLAEIEVEDLVENLRFNQYIDRENGLVDNATLLQVDADSLLLAPQFYPHREAILTVLQTHIGQSKNQCYTLKKELFFDIAEQLAADWSFDAISQHCLQDGRIGEEKKAFFENPENAANLDVAWPFEPNDNRAVFDRIRSIIQVADQYRFTHAPLEKLDFDIAEINALIRHLQDSGYLSGDRQLPEDQIPYFLNVNNVLTFTVETFEDYNKDIFFILHSLAKQVDKVTQEIAALHRDLEASQTRILYHSLQEAFGLGSESIEAIAEQVFAGSANVRDEWLVPILATVNSNDTIDREPENSRFNTAYRRVQQFALLAAKLKLDPDEIVIAFHDQALVEKYPDSLELPEKPASGDSRKRITHFDALLESTHGCIYLFKSANPEISNDYARVWTYSSTTHELIETENDRLSTLLTGDKENTVHVSRVNAAYVDKDGNDVIVADGKYYVKECAKNESVWQLRERQWGKVDSDFEEVHAIDAAFTDASGQTYLFSNNQFARYSNDLTSIDDSYPKNIAESWCDEGKTHNLPEAFHTSLDAAFHGTDNATYFFNRNRFVSSEAPATTQATRDVWGKVKNNLQGAYRIDACYADGDLYIVLSGDQVFAYRDCLENDAVAIQEGFPKALTDHFGGALPGEFHAGVDAAFKGEDGNIHLFKGETSVSFTSGDTKGTTVATKDKWGLVDNDLAAKGVINAAFAALDGRIYLFSGAQYFRYSGSDYSEVDSGYPRSVSEDWGGLTQINAAFVLDGKTYLFGTGKVEQDDDRQVVKNAYVRYSTNDYDQPDDGYPKEQVETDDFWWNLPESIKQSPSFTEVDAVLNARDGKTFLFSKDVFIYFDHMQRWWSEPKKLSDMWENIPFTSIDAAFYGKDGKTYLFRGDEYVRLSGDDYSWLDNGYPRPTSRFWGNVKNNITERGTIDAALVVESREAEEQADGSTKTVQTMHTYLFSGDQFVRYKNAAYSRIEPGYPKAICELKAEPRFQHLDATLKSGIDAAFGDHRNVYLFEGSTIHIVSEAPYVTYLGRDKDAFREVDCAFMDQGAVYAEKANGWYHFSSPEGRDVVLTPEAPPLLTDVRADYQNGLSAVLQGTDTNTYLFKGDTFFNVQLNREYPIADYWGRVRNNVQDEGTIDAVFVGRDGNTYVFSGDQYVVYSNRAYIGQEVVSDAEYADAVKPIADHWGGLTSVHLAYVMEDETYLFEKPDEAGSFRYVRYSTTDYESPDAGFPQVVDAAFWQIPSEYRDEGWDDFDAIVIENDTTMLFIKDGEFLRYHVSANHWALPTSLDMLWDGVYREEQVFDNLQSAFVGADGTAYFFGDTSYITYQNGGFTDRRSIRDDWGILPTSFKTKVDAACVHQETVTYLFSGDQYVRYSGTDYRNVDDGYPKLIMQDLRCETGFQNLPAAFEVQAGELNTDADSVIISAAVANAGNIYLYMGGNCYISSSCTTRTYNLDILGQQRNRLCETGEIDAALVRVVPQSAARQTYLFSGDQYVRYSESEYRYVDDGYPKRIATGLASDLGDAPIPSAFHGGIDAALQDRDGTIYLFKDQTVFNVDTGKTSAIKDTLGKAKNNFVPTTADAPMDGAFVDSMGRLYVFKGDQFIRYADTAQDYVETGYPKRIASTFQNLPERFTTDIDGAFTFEGRTYLVKGDDYVRYLSDDYRHPPSFYPVAFIDHWGNWSDYLIKDIQAIARFKDLQDSYRGDHTLVDLLKTDQGYVKNPYAALADMFNWDIEEVKWLKRNNTFLPLATEFNLEFICRMFDILSLCDKMGAGVSAYQDIWNKIYSDSPQLAEAADALRKLLGTQNGTHPDWKLLADEVHNKLNLLKRDVLVPYTIFTAGDAVKDTRDLYEKLLIDIQMGECAHTSRIEEAIAAVQLFFHRYFINLEHVRLKKGDPQREVLKERWKWMRNYRVWEANRKVFLYPENYIRPELRDTKTPEFKTLEQELLQGELTPENVTRAFKHYIDQYTEVSRLKIAGGYVYDNADDPDDKDIILFGRTKSEPRQYYYRMATFVNGQSDAVLWQPWLQINVQIDADRVYPVFAFNKVFVFWAVVEMRSSIGPDSKLKLKHKDDNSGYESETDAVNESVLQMYYSYFNLNGEWASPQKIHYEITSNDTITEFFLDFSDNREEAHQNLDHIQVRCHYTTERQIKPTLNKKGEVKYKELKRAANGNDSDADSADPIIVYLKASNASDTYYIETRPDGKAYVKQLLPGDTLSDAAKFKVVTGSSETISLAPFSQNGANRLLLNERFTVIKGLIGDGYSFLPASAKDQIMYYREADGSAVEIETWSEFQTLTAQRQATFSFITNRIDQETTFRFYPETNSAKEHIDTAGSPNASLQGVEVLRSGIHIFKDLFPNEDASEVGRPVLLNVPENRRSIPWICFDYKGGSFLCKPTSGQTQEGTKGTIKELVNLEKLPDDFKLPIAAALHAGGRTYLFSEAGQYIDDIDIEGQTKSIRATWGIVDNHIQSDKPVDSALFRDGKIFLFCEDQYVVYSHGYDAYVDESYPKRLGDNPDDGLPKWDRIDASFQADGKTYFVRGDEYVTSDNLDEPFKISDKLWPVATKPSEVRNVFTHMGTTYTFNHQGKLFQETSHMDLINKLNLHYNEPASANDIPLVTAAFAIGTTVYMNVGNNDYKKYEGGNANWVFKYLNAAQNMKAVFVAGDFFYILNRTDGLSILRWNKHSSTGPESTITISNAPSEDEDTFFYDGQNVYIFSGNDYMKLDELPDGSVESIPWTKATDTIADYIRDAGVLTPVTEIDAGFNLDDDVFIISGDHYFRFTDATLSAPDSDAPKSLRGVDRDGLPAGKSIAAGFKGADNIVRLFGGKHFSEYNYEANEPLTARGPDEPIKNTWGKVRNTIQETGRVDAAFTIGNETYLISGDQYYLYKGNLDTLEPGYPIRFDHNRAGLPTWRRQDVTSAFEMGGKVYVFLAVGVYAEFDPEAKQSRYRVTADNWQWPTAYRDFDAAYSQGGHLFLIAGENYLKYENPTTELVQQGNVQYDIIRLSSMTGSRLNQALFAGGIDGLMQRSTQEIDELPTFVFNGAQTGNRAQTGDAVIQVNPQKVSDQHFPVHSHLEFRGANGVYYWELFYHAPALIAQSLNTNQKFEDAKQWYEYIFDPTDVGQYWKFLPFLAVDVGALIAAIAPWKTDGAVGEAVKNLIAKLRDWAPALLGRASMSGDLKGAFDRELEALETAARGHQDLAAIQEVSALIQRLPIRYALMTSNGLEQIKTYLDDPFDPHAIAALRRIAYRRTTVMAYIDNLLDWGDMLFRQYTRESINEARMLYILAYDLLGKKPASLGTKVLSEALTYDALQARQEIGTENKVNAYDFLFDTSRDGDEQRGLTHAGVVHKSVKDPYFYIPENAQVLGYWERVEDRLYKIRHCLNILGIKQPLPLFQPPIDPMAIVSAVAGGGGLSAALAGTQVAVPHYRFTFMLNKARELVGKLNQFGNDLLGALEKKDAEELSLLQNRQEGIILQMTREIKIAQLREAEEGLKNLEESKVSAENQKQHYDSLIDAGLITEEEVQIGMMITASTLFALIPILKLAAAIVNAAPNVKVGAPTTMGASVGGSTLGASLGFIAESGESIAEAISMGGEVAGIYAQHQRSVEDWRLQLQMAESEIKQLEYQIEGAKWQIRAAEHEIVVNEKETDHNQSINTFMKEKFSNQQLYLWMSGKLSALYFQTYKMAHDMAKSAEMAYRFERGVPESEVNFIGGSYWDSLNKGLLAGDSLGLDLDRMEQAYLETHARAFEITKTISLLELDPMAFLQLKSKRVCDFHFTEELFDYDFPGHYRRQVKTIALKLSAGEGKTVNATLTQLRNKTVMEADTKAVKYLLSPTDSQPLTIRNDWRPSQQIAVSDVDPYSENSSGLFELNFGDDRYLPFEGTGAISSWRLELSGKKGSYNINELTDVEIELKYTAQQGGQAFADAVKGLLKPYPTAVYIDMAQTFPNEFFAFVYDETEDLKISVTRDMFPNLYGSKITGIYSFFEVKEEGQISMVMNDDSALTLRDQKLLLTHSLAVGQRGETWTFEAKGKKSDLVNMGLVFAYKATVE